MTSVAEQALREKNPKESWAPMPQRALVPGWTDHRVLRALPDGNAEQRETIEMVAALHSQSPQRLRAANNLADTAQPAPEHVLLVPLG
jgi:hypothetical protein